ncbi:Glutaminyl-tRNA synthetase [Batrachochytrium dendrobatidis]|nr:Glutaminyl-tRNA synthetase [Batrachochytrium dendrobatidis]
MLQRPSALFLLIQRTVLLGLTRNPVYTLQSHSIVNRLRSLDNCTALFLPINPSTAIRTIHSTAGLQNMSASELTDLFTRIGLSDVKAKETAANKKLAPTLTQVITEAGVTADGVEKSLGALLYTLASTITKDATVHLPYLAKAVFNGNLTSSDQVSAAIKFSEKATGPIDDIAFNEACGVGVVVTSDEITASVAALVAEKKVELEEKRYQMLGSLLGLMRTRLRWANSLAVKEELDRQILALLGPKDERDNLKTKKKKEKEAKAASIPAADAPVESRIEDMAKSTKFIFEGELARLHRPGENPQIKPELMVEHLKRTKGRVQTRFPPEPNGFLHIGHAKAININFSYAAAFGGTTNLRYDDTNPEAEEESYLTAIKDTIEWLGFKPSAITYSSDHFQKLYDLAVDLIKRDKAYVCHCTGEEIYQHRGGDSKGPRTECVHRNRPVSESLAEFQKMKEGRYKEGEAILRMKMDLTNPNPQFWDLVAYRVLFTAHHRTGSDWCIYPTYDYTHCLCDSFEDITHSLCTTEFRLSRESYYWLVDALEIYKPVQWEYGRLNITNTVMSKRKLNQLVTEGLVEGWDDPRLYTLAALRRRGFTPESINAFVRDVGVTTANTTMNADRLEGYLRDHLNQTVSRLFVILDPVKVTLTNVSDDMIEEIEVANKPKDATLGSRVLPFTKTVYIDRSDFREKDESGEFYRLVLGKSVGLLNVPFPIQATEVVKDPSTGKIIEIKAVYEKDGISSRPKAYIQWVGVSPKHQSPVHVTARLYEKLFLHANPQSKEEVPGGWLSDLNPDSLQIVEGAMADIGILNTKIEDKFQAVRVAYFCVDRNSDFKTGKIVLNRTVGLKEDNKKDK